MAGLKNILTQYARFEIRVRDLITSLCAPHCSTCSNVCCRSDFCRESIESPFLSMLHAKFPPAAQYSIEKGWLYDSGCALSCGRPPVCYEFFCNPILTAISSPIHRYVVEVLSRLVSHAGSKALGRRHLVEITRMQELQRLKFYRIEIRLQEAADALAAVVTFLDKGCMEKTAFDSLVKIYPPIDSQDLIQSAPVNRPESILTVKISADSALNRMTRIRPTNSGD